MRLNVDEKLLCHQRMTAEMNCKASMDVHDCIVTWRERSLVPNDRRNMQYLV